jgi:palmitoyltransferase ZDHHC9/14/18
VGEQLRWTAQLHLFLCVPGVCCKCCEPLPDQYKSNIPQVLTLCLVICTSALHLYLLTRRDGINFLSALRKGPGSGVAFLLAIVVIWPVTALLVYHMRVSCKLFIPYVVIHSPEHMKQLLLLNITTIEQVGL